MDRGRRNINTLLFDNNINMEKFTDGICQYRSRLGQNPLFYSRNCFGEKRIGLKTFLGIGIGLLGVFWGLKISEHVLITNIINRSLFGIVLGLIFLLILIIMMNALECFLIYEKFIRKILAFLGNITMEVYILHVAFRSIFDYPAEIGKYMILIGASILIAIPVNRIGKYIVNINRLRR